MPDITIQDPLWRDVTAAARKYRRKARSLVEKAIRLYLERLDDEELWASSAKQARRAKFKIDETEEIIRQYRRKRRGT